MFYSHIMVFFIFFLILLSWKCVKSEQFNKFNLSGISENHMRHLERKKRYIAFPEGSSVSAALCLTVGVIGNPNVNWLSWAVNWGLAYDLPSYSWAKEHANGFSNRSKESAQSRSRRDLYEKIELIIEKMGFNGQICLAQALCESATFARKSFAKKSNMFEELAKSIFSLPAESLDINMVTGLGNYYTIFSKAFQHDTDCTKLYSMCGFSLFDFFRGKYVSQYGINGKSFKKIAPLT